MTQHEIVLREMIAHPKTGVTVRDGLRLGINWIHKRVGELEQLGVKVKRIDAEENGKRFRRYVLMDVQQDVVADLLSFYESRRAS